MNEELARKEAERIFREIAPLGYEGEPLPAIEIIHQALLDAEQRARREVLKVVADRYGVDTANEIASAIRQGGTG